MTKLEWAFTVEGPTRHRWGRPQPLSRPTGWLERRSRQVLLGRPMASTWQLSGATVRVWALWVANQELQAGLRHQAHRRELSSHQTGWSREWTQYRGPHLVSWSTRTSPITGWRQREQCWPCLRSRCYRQTAPTGPEVKVLPFPAGHRWGTFWPFLILTITMLDETGKFWMKTMTTHLLVSASTNPAQTTLRVKRFLREGLKP